MSADGASTTTETSDTPTIKGDNGVLSPPTPEFDDDNLPAYSTYHVYRPLHILELLMHNFGQRLGMAANNLSDVWIKTSKRNQMDKLCGMDGATTRWTQDCRVKTKCQEELVSHELRKRRRR